MALLWDALATCVIRTSLESPLWANITGGLEQMSPETVHRVQHVQPPPVTLAGCGFTHSRTSGCATAP